MCYVAAAAFRRALRFLIERLTSVEDPGIDQHETHEEIPPRSKSTRITLESRGHSSGRDASAAERFIEHVGFAACLTDSRRPGPSLYVAVCGRRDVVMPRNVQKDPEASLTWVLKDELVRRGRVYYAKLSRGKTMFVAPRMIPYFHAVWGVRRSEEKRRIEQERAGDLPGGPGGAGNRHRGPPRRVRHEG